MDLKGKLILFLAGCRFTEVETAAILADDILHASILRASPQFAWADLPFAVGSVHRALGSFAAPDALEIFQRDHQDPLIKFMVICG